MMTESCASCRFLLCHAGEDVDVGICRRYPPKFNPIVFEAWQTMNGPGGEERAEGFDWDEPFNRGGHNDVIAHQFPMVRKPMWCGEFSVSPHIDTDQTSLATVPTVIKPIS